MMCSKKNVLEETSDDDCCDDPIRLIDGEQYRVNNVAEYPLLGIQMNRKINSPKKGAWQIVNQTKQRTGMAPGDLKKYMPPISFFDVPNNVRMLNKCRPLYIKLIDCYKNPKNIKRVKNITKSITQDTSMHNLEVKPHAVSNERSTKDDVLSDKYEGKGKKKSPTASRIRTKQSVNVKQEIELAKYKALRQKNNTVIDYKKNSGLVGLRIKFMTDYSPYPFFLNGKISNFKSSTDRQYQKATHKIKNVKSKEVEGTNNTCNENNINTDSNSKCVSNFSKSIKKNGDCNSFKVLIKQTNDCDLNINKKKQTDANLSHEGNFKLRQKIKNNTTKKCVDSEGVLINKMVNVSVNKIKNSKNKTSKNKNKNVIKKVEDSQHFEELHSNINKDLQREILKKSDSKGEKISASSQPRTNAAPEYVKNLSETYQAIKNNQFDNKKNSVPANTMVENVNAKQELSLSKPVSHLEKAAALKKDSNAVKELEQSRAPEKVNPTTIPLFKNIPDGVRATSKQNNTNAQNSSKEFGSPDKALSHSTPKSFISAIINQNIKTNSNEVQRGMLEKTKGLSMYQQLVYQNAIEPVLNYSAECDTPQTKGLFKQKQNICSQSTEYQKGSLSTAASFQTPCSYTPALSGLSLNGVQQNIQHDSVTLPGSNSEHNETKVTPNITLQQSYNHHQSPLNFQNNTNENVYKIPSIMSDKLPINKMQQSNVPQYKTNITSSLTNKISHPNFVGEIHNYSGRTPFIMPQNDLYNNNNTAQNTIVYGNTVPMHNCDSVSFDAQYVNLPPPNLLPRPQCTYAGSSPIMIPNYENLVTVPPPTQQFFLNTVSYPPPAVQNYQNIRSFRPPLQNSFRDVSENSVIGKNVEGVVRKINLIPVPAKNNEKIRMKINKGNKVKLNFMGNKKSQLENKILLTSVNVGERNRKISSNKDSQSCVYSPSILPKPTSNPQQVANNIVGKTFSNVRSLILPNLKTKCPGEISKPVEDSRLKKISIGEYRKRND